jgi:hypothetical protein
MSIVFTRPAASPLPAGRVRLALATLAAAALAVMSSLQPVHAADAPLTAEQQQVQQQIQQTVQLLAQIQTQYDQYRSAYQWAASIVHPDLCRSLPGYSQLYYCQVQTQAQSAMSYLQLQARILKAQLDSLFLANYSLAAQAAQAAQPTTAPQHVYLPTFTQRQQSSLQGLQLWNSAFTGWASSAYSLPTAIEAITKTAQGGWNLGRFV